MQNQKSPSSCRFAEAKPASVRGGGQGRKAQEKCGFCDYAEGGEQTILEPDKSVLPQLELRASTCPEQQSPDPSAPCCAPTSAGSFPQVSQERRSLQLCTAAAQLAALAWHRAHALHRAGPLLCWIQNGKEGGTQGPFSVPPLPVSSVQAAGGSTVRTGDVNWPKALPYQLHGESWPAWGTHLGGADCCSGTGWASGSTCWGIVLGITSSSLVSVLSPPLFQHQC